MAEYRFDPSRLSPPALAFHEAAGFGDSLPLPLRARVVRRVAAGDTPEAITADEVTRLSAIEGGRRRLDSLADRRRLDHRRRRQCVGQRWR